MRACVATEIGALVAHDPAVIVDAAHGIAGVAGLDVEQVLADRAVEPAWRWRAGAAGRRSRSTDSGAAAAASSGRSERAKTRPWPGSTTPQPKVASL